MSSSKEYLSNAESENNQGVVFDIQPYADVLTREQQYELRRRFGGKGLGLLELASLGLQVADGFIITTEACRSYYYENGNLPGVVSGEISEGLARLEKKTNKRLGDPNLPLFIAARSGAPHSAPGIYDTYHYLGLTQQTLPALEKEIGKRQAWKAYAGLYADFAVKLFAVPKGKIDKLLPNGYTSTEQYVHMCRKSVRSIQKLLAQSGYPADFLENASNQVWYGIYGVFNSWYKPGAKQYRSSRMLQDSDYTAVVIQQMVHADSPKGLAGAGVWFTHSTDYSTHSPQGEFARAVLGTTIVSELRSANAKQNLHDLPRPIRTALQRDLNVLRSHFLHPQEIEFATRPDGTVILLQTRDAQLSREARYRMTMDLLKRNAISPDVAIRTLNQKLLRGLTSPDLHPASLEKARRQGRILAEGFDISPGGATGRVVKSLARAEKMYKKDFEKGREHNPRPVIVWQNFSAIDFDKPLPRDVVGIIMTNASPGAHVCRHAEQVGREMGIPIVAGVAKRKRVALQKIVTLDGTNGLVINGMISKSTRGSRLLSRDELTLAKRLLEKKSRNPWAYTVPRELVDRYKTLGRKAKERARQHQSVKGQAIAAMNRIFPEELRVSQYIPVRVDRKNRQYTYHRIQELAERFFTEGNHVSLRTGHVPQRKGGGPYVVIRTRKQLDGALHDPLYSKYGCLDSLWQDRELKNIVVGGFPQEKMDVRNEKVKRRHAGFSISCLPGGDVVISIHPGSPLLRDLSEASDENMAQIIINPDPTAKEEERYRLVIGDNLKTNSIWAYPFIRHAIEQIFSWQTHHQLFARLSCFANIFPTREYAPVSLEGQMRVDPKTGKLLWISLYEPNVDAKGTNR